MKKLLCIMLAAFMAVSLMPVTALAEDAPATPTVEGSVLYANGTALVFEGSYNQTRIFIDKNRNGAVDVGEERFYPDSAKSENGCDLYGWTIYGGSKGNYTGDTKLTFLGGGVQDVYGGCDGGTLTGNTAITILGNSTVKGSVYGGSNNTGTGKGIVGSTSVTLGVAGKNVAAKVLGNVYGGGNQSSVIGNTNVELLGTGAQAANVFGGGCGKYALVDGNTNITSGGVVATGSASGTVVFGGIYGGGYDPSTSDTAEITSVYPTVSGKATIEMTGGWANKIVGAGTCAAYENNSANNVNLLPKLTVKEAVITVSGGTVRNGIDAKERMETANNVTVTGGSIAGAIELGSGKKLLDASGNELYKTTLDVSDVLSEVKETELSAFSLARGDSQTYGTNGLVTDASGKLYFYLPAGCTAVARYKGVNQAVNGVKDDGTSIFERFCVDTANEMIYANMNPIKLVSGTTSGYTNILYDKNGDGKIAASEMLKIGTDEPTAEGYDLSSYIVYLGFLKFDGEYSTDLTMDGGCVKMIHCNGSGNTSKYGIEAEINDGTVLDIINLGYANTDTGVKTLEINGGNIDLSNCPDPVDKNGNAVYPALLTLPDITALTGVSDKLTLKKGDSAAAYGTASIYTKNGLLRFWLPADKDGSSAPVRTTYTATYTTTPAEPDYTAYVDPAESEPYLFRQTSEALTVSDNKVVKASAADVSVSYEVTNSPVPTPITNGLKIYTYDEETEEYTACTAVTASLSGTALTLTATSGAITAGTYYVTVTEEDTAGIEKWESEKLALTVADPLPELEDNTLYTNTLDVKITADADGTYACADINGNGSFEDSEFVMDSADPEKKLNIAGFDVDASGKTATVTAGTLGTVTAKDVVIDGGSVKDVTADTIKNTAGAELCKATVTLSGVTDARTVTATDVSGYDVTGVNTDGGKLYFWLPENTEIKSVTAGSTYTGTLTVTSGGAAAATFTVPSSGGGGGGGGSTAPAENSIVIGECKNGTVTADQETAAAGDTVTLTITPDKGFTLETLVITDEDGKEIELKKLSDTEYSFTVPDGEVTVTATFMEDNTMLNFFVDVKATDYFYDSVLWAAENGITSGTDATHFSPAAPVTRAQVVTFLWNAAGKPVVNYLIQMDDVLSDAYYTEAVRWALSEGIARGTSDTTFSPDAICTRAQIVTLLAHFAGVKDTSAESVFTDVNATDYFAAPVKWAKDNGVTAGTSDTTFSPYDECTRAQAVTFLYNWMVR